MPFSPPKSSYVAITVVFKAPNSLINHRNLVILWSYQFFLRVVFEFREANIVWKFWTFLFHFYSKQKRHKLTINFESKWRLICSEKSNTLMQSTFSSKISKLLHIFYITNLLMALISVMAMADFISKSRPLLKCKS